MRQGRRGDEGAALGSGIGNVQDGASLGNRGVDRKNLITEGAEHVFLQPSAQGCALLWIAPFDK